MKRSKFLSVLLLVTFVLVVGIAATLFAQQQKSVILATTTSTQDSGLLDVLIPMFEKQSGCFVKTVAVGSGQAMAMGEKGEADVLLVHSPAAEQKFMANDYGVNRRLVMHNDFVIVGPPSDPAKVKQTKTAAEALKKIAESNSLFISRGDNSGTHAKEKGVWKQTGINPTGKKWYQETGLGMGQTLNVANEKRGYTLADRGTFLALKKNLDLAVLEEGDAALLNPYHVIQVNPKKYPKVHADCAKSFADFMVSEQAQATINKFGTEKFGEPLFVADAGKSMEELPGKKKLLSTPGKS